MLEADGKVFLKIVKSRRVHLGLRALLRRTLHLLRVRVLLLRLLVHHQSEIVVGFGRGGRHLGLILLGEKLGDVHAGITALEVGYGGDVDGVPEFVIALLAVFLVHEYAVGGLFLHCLFN